MNVKTFENRYCLLEFHHYIDQIDEDTQINIVELLLNIEAEDIDFLDNELSHIFAIETNKQTYVFSGYEVSECYKVNDNGNLVRVVCIQCI